MSILIEYLPSLLSVSGIMLVALISPGPDFAVVVKNSLLYSRKTALLTALGIALGVLTHVFYALLGLGFLIKSTPWLFHSIKYVGVGYLLYIGYKGLRAKKANLEFDSVKRLDDISPQKALWSGFLTNALNPKCMLFFVSLFSIVVSPDTPRIVMMAYGLTNFIETLVWFSFVAFCLSGKRTREKFKAAGHWVERITGGVLVGLGIKLLFAV